MARTTDERSSGDGEISAFYDALAEEYHAMTLPEQRLARELPLFRTIVERYGVRTAVDAGSGTGFHTLLLARLGVDVTAVDISPAMMRRLAENAMSLGLAVHTAQGSLRDLPSLFPGTADALFCMGNTLPHLLSEEELAETLRGFARVIRSDGLLLLQLLNYDRIMRRRERIQHVREEGNLTFIRFYDYEDPLIRFNLVRLERTPGGIRHRLAAVPLMPIRSTGLREALGRAGYGNVELFGDIALGGFEPDTSVDLVVLARRMESR